MGYIIRDDDWSSDDSDVDGYSSDRRYYSSDSVQSTRVNPTGKHKGNDSPTAPAPLTNWKSAPDWPSISRTPLSPDDIARLRMLSNTVPLDASGTDATTARSDSVHEDVFCTHVAHGREIHLTPMVLANFSTIPERAKDRMFRWTRDSITLSNFKRALAVKVLESVERAHVERSGSAVVVKLGTTVRLEADAQDLDQAPYVLFTCFPFLEANPEPTGRLATTTESSRRMASNWTQGLMQSQYPYVMLENRDQEQLVRQHNVLGRKQVLQVSQFWALTFSDGLLVTCSRIPKEALQPGIQKSLSLSFDPDTLHVRVVDAFSRSFCFSIRRPSTLLDLEAALHEILESDNSRVLGDYNIYAKIPEAQRLVSIAKVLESGQTAQSLLIRVSPSESAPDKVIDGDRWAVCHPAQISITKVSVPPWNPPTTSLSPPNVPSFFTWPSSADPRRGKRTEEWWLDHADGDFVAGRVPPQWKVKRPLLRPDNSEEATTRSESDARCLLDELGTANRSSDNGVDERLGELEGMDLMWRKDRLYKTLQTCVDRVSDLLGAFSSNQTEDSPIPRCWGAVYSVISTVKSVSAEALKTPGDQKKTWLAVNRRCPYRRGVWKRSSVSGKDSDWESAWLRPPDETSDAGVYSYFVDEHAMQPEMPRSLTALSLVVSLESCYKCSRAQEYCSVDRLRRHLRDKHFDARERMRPGFEQETWAFMTSSDRWATELKLHYLELLVFMAAYTTKKLLDRCLHLQHGVMDMNSNKDPKYLMWQEIYWAFLAVVHFIVSLERAAEHIDKTLNNATPDWEPIINLPPAFETVTRYAAIAMTALDDARLDLYRAVQMSAGDEQHSIPPSITFGSNVTLCGILSILATKPITVDEWTTEGVVHLYQKAQTSLSLYANMRPTKRLLRSIRFGREELTAIQQLYSCQERAIKDFVLLCADNTYATRSKRRANQYQFAEQMEKAILSHLAEESRRLDELAKTFARLDERTSWNIEIYESDHNKAIFLFGVVALIFVPLSFFTSYFGMNTVDIRDMDADQGDFWKTALPISAAVVGSALVFAYYGEHIRNWLSQLPLVFERPVASDGGEVGTVKRDGFRGVDGIFQLPPPPPPPQPALSAEEAQVLQVFIQGLKEAD
ncbi:uncharacterized protein F5Z01DRAFT_697683 [Emericellopsis atlantica]|uniref:Uncharacterized protein n=1 Tax=Emericellopsis atlantica TaxID=2614577 RepID=A0A9P7ZSL4_9HYPO|nr:uncharacterized protein F5Z01DRAFT_697683 [Emericellopsis atlantica]KAG9256925.1 hypothetical protein F5Z01DRAFT_697683 [Emericellopsis atlantica]